jgi:hypothetical protein
MRLIFIFLFLLANTALAKPGPGFMPTRNKRGKRPNSTVTHANLPRGPQYSQPGPPSAAEVQQNIINMKPNSPNEVAAPTGIGQGNCDKSALTRMQALVAQITALAAQADIDARRGYSCGANPACYQSVLDKVNADTVQLAALKDQLIALAPAAQAAANCTGGGPGMAPVPGATLQNMAARFGATKGASGAAGIRGGGSPRASLALEQAQELADEGEAADWDRGNPRLPKAMASYGNAARRAAAVGSRVQAGRQFAGKMPSFDNPTQLAQAEYMKINYKELGPKYEALAQERAQAADNVASETINSLGSPAPLMESEIPPMIALDEAQAVSLGGAGLVDKAGESLLEGAKDALSDTLSPQWKAMKSIVEINQAVGKAWDLQGDLMDAINEMGSGSLSTASTEKMIAKLDQYFSDVKDATFEKNPFKSLLGAN